MTLSNYPPGVTGNEYEIAGPDSEWEEELHCDKCEKDELFYCESFQKQRSGRCPVCDNHIDLGHNDDYIDWDNVREEKEDFERHRIEMGWD